MFNSPVNFTDPSGLQSFASTGIFQLTRHEIVGAIGNFLGYICGFLTAMGELQKDSKLSDTDREILAHKYALAGAAIGATVGFGISALISLDPIGGPTMAYLLATAGGISYIQQWWEAETGLEKGAAVFCAFSFGATLGAGLALRPRPNVSAVRPEAPRTGWKQALGRFLKKNDGYEVVLSGEDALTRSRGQISGDVSKLLEKNIQFRAGKKSTVAEIRSARAFAAEGQNVHFVPTGEEITPDFVVGGRTGTGVGGISFEVSAPRVGGTIDSGERLDRLVSAVVRKARRGQSTRLVVDVTDARLPVDHLHDVLRRTNLSLESLGSSKRIQTIRFVHGEAFVLTLQ